MLANKGHPNRLGIVGWLAGGRWGPERYLYSLHRLTGLALLAYFVMHIGLTTTRALGQESWENAMTRVSGQLFVVGEYLVFLAFAFHAVSLGPDLSAVWAQGAPNEVSDLFLTDQQSLLFVGHGVSFLMNCFR